MRLPTEGIDYTNKDYEAFRRMMLEALEVKMPEYTDLRESDAGVVLIELLAQGLDIISFYQDVIANEVFLPTAEQRSNVLKWCQILGYLPKNSTPSTFRQIFVLSSVQPTPTTIPKGTVVKTAKTAVEAEVKFETQQDLIIPANSLGDEVDSEGNYLYAVDIVQGITVSNELVGSSNGTPNQEFTLNYTPVIQKSVLLLINEGSGFEKWTRVDSFIESKPTSKHYVVTINEANEAVITFGDNIFGKIPTAFANGIYAEYRIGGGITGNVGAEKITVIEKSIALVRSTINPFVADTLGQDRESLEEIKRNAPLSNLTLWGAITYEDYATVAKSNFPDITFAISGGTTTSVFDVNLYLLLKENRPLTDEFKKEILDLFDANEGGRKIVGAGEVNVLPPNFRPITFNLSLVVQDRYSVADVESAITTLISNYLEIGTYPFNTDLVMSEVLAYVLQNVPQGIKSLKITSPTEDIISAEIDDIFTLESVNYTTTGGV